MIFDVLVGKTLKEINLIQIIEEYESFDLLGTCILKFKNNLTMQVNVDVPHKQMTYIDTVNSILIWGEFKPVQINLLPFSETFLTFPFFIEEVITYTTTHSSITGTWKDVDLKEGNNYILGATIKNNTNEFFIRTAGDELVIQRVEEAEYFFSLCDLDFKKWHNKHIKK